MEVQIPYQEMQKTPGPGALFLMVCSSKYFWVGKKNMFCFSVFLSAHEMELFW